MNISIDTSRIDLVGYAKKIDGAMASAINHTTAKAQTAANKAMRSEWNLKLSDIKKYETIRKANKNQVVAVFKLKSKAISLLYFSAKQTKKGVRYKVKVRGGTKVRPHAFIAKMRNGQYGVFNRSTKKSLPIVKAYTITPTTMFKKDGLEEFNKVIDRDLKARFDYEIGRLMR